MAYMYNPIIKVSEIVREASSPEDKKYINKMNKDDVNQVNAALIQNLYTSVLNKKKCDFGDIPASQGDIEKVKYYENTVECLDILENLLRAHNISDPSINDVRNAISNMKALRQQFMYGFKIKHEFIMVMYNTLVLAIIDATASITTEYITFIIGSSEAEFKMTGNHDKQKGNVCLDSIRKFNDGCRNGSISKSMSFMLDEHKKNFLGMAILVTGVIIMGLIALVTLIRELIFFFYHSRVTLSDYLELQASLLEMNKLAVESSTKPPSEKKNIIRKQEKTIKKLREISNKIAVNNVNTNDVAKKELKNEDSMWSLPNIEKQITNNKLNGNEGFKII